VRGLDETQILMRRPQQPLTKRRAGGILKLFVAVMSFQGFCGSFFHVPEKKTDKKITPVSDLLFADRGYFSEFLISNIF